MFKNTGTMDTIDLCRTPFLSLCLFKLSNTKVFALILWLLVYELGYLWMLERGGVGVWGSNDHYSLQDATKKG